MFSCQPTSVMPLKVVLKNFLNHFETLEARKKLGDDLFEAEFQSLKELTERLKLDPEYACTEGQKEVNRKKNRYKDILPYDLSRVILSEYPGVPGSDYINANLIKGASGSRAYIASQGPLPTTVMDFWRMIWECEVQVIIMACNEKESGKYKCERYWPNEGDKKQYGNITVELVKWKQVCPDFLLRTLRARCGQEERTLCQFHYWSWPDHGVPTSVGPIVDLVRLVRDCQASEALPVLVHCSAGCGRTGTICAIDYVWGLMRVGKLTDSFSLYQIIREMRMQRIAMVQTKEQYVLVHRVVAALFEQQLRIIDSHTYENLDEDGEPLLGTGSSGNVPSNDKIYENLDDLGLEDRGHEKENTENDEKCDKEKEVTAGSEESLSKAPLPQDATADSAGNEDTSQRQVRASRSMSWSPEPNSVATSSSALSSSDPRGGSHSSMITDDEDSQSCKEESVQMKKCLDKKKNGDEQGSTLSRGRSLSATNICLEDPAGKVGKGDTAGKIVGKATVIRRPSIARLKALFEKSDSDDVSAGEANRRRPVFRSYSQRITPRRPSVAQVPDGVEAPSMASKFKPLLSKRKSLGPSARKAKEFRDQEKSQRQLGAASSAATSKMESQAGQPVPETVPTTKVMTTPPMLMVSSSSEANTRPQGAASSLSGTGGDTWEKNVLYKSFSSSNLSGLASQATGNVSSSKPLSEASRVSLSSSVSSKLGQKCDPPPQLPMKKRTAQTLYAPIPFYTVDPVARKSQTLPALVGNANNTQPQQSQARGSSIYDFLPRKDADMPPRLPPKTKLSKLQTPVVPISALNNTYVNVSDMLLARNELMSRLSDGRYMNVNPEAKENLKRIESVIRQHPRGAIIDLTSRKSFNDRIAAVSKYEQVWDGKTFVRRDPKAETEPGKTVAAGQPTKNEGDSWFGAQRDCYESGTSIDNSTNKERSATLPSAFRTHDRTNQRDFPPHGTKQDPLAMSSSDMDTSDIYTTHDERSGTEYDTLFAESSDATETDAPCEKDGRWKALVGIHPGHAHAMPPQLTKNMPGHAAMADTEVKRPLPAYETIYPLQPGFIGRRVPYTNNNPPPKPPRTYGYCASGKYEAGHVGAPVAYPKKAQLSESIYQVPPQPRTTPHMISRPLHRLPSSCDPSAFLPSGVPNFGAAPFVPLYHPRQGVSAIRSPDYENVYACRSAVADGQSSSRQQGTRIVKHHSEYRPQVKAPPRESESSRPGNTVPTVKAPLQHSFSDASIYEALRGSLSQPPQHQQEQQRLADIQAQYAVVVKPKKSGLQKSKTVVSESALLGPSAPPRCRRQTQQDSADSSDGAGCKVAKQGGAGDVAEVHAKPSKKGTASGNKGSSKEGSSSGSEGSGFISGTLSKAFGRLNPFYRANSGASEEAKKKSTSQSTTGSPKKPEVPKKPGNIAMLRTSKKQPAPQPKVSKPPDFVGRPLSQAPNDSASEHWTQV